MPDLSEPPPTGRRRRAAEPAQDFSDDGGEDDPAWPGEPARPVDPGAPLDPAAQVDSVSPVDPAGPQDQVADHRARRVRYSPHHAWGRVAQRWVPEPLREARIDPGRRGALLLTVVAAVAAVVAAVGVWRGQPEPHPVQAVSLTQAGDGAAVATTGRVAGSLRPATAAPTTNPAGGTRDGASVAAAGPSATPTSAGLEVLIVSVTGAVRSPGLVRLPPGSRVADAIAQAGGATAAADLTGLNLAARLADGASVVVSDQPGAGGSSVSGLGSATNGAGVPVTPGSGQPAGKVDLNTADATTLDALPGVGPVTAAAIVAWREKNGRYTSVEQLQEIAGIGPAKYAALSVLVTVG